MHANDDIRPLPPFAREFVESLVSCSFRIVIQPGHHVVLTESIQRGKEQASRRDKIAPSLGTKKRFNRRTPEIDPPRPKSDKAVQLR